MATLYTTDTGFRFPYPKWNRTSTPKNLLFLEALLEKYLHVHETVSSTLYVTPSGYRMPYKKSPDNLEENMKFVERQLEHALHFHEVIEPTVTADVETDLALDPEFNLTTDGFKGIGDTLPTADASYYWANQDAVHSISTANPRVGANHARAATTGSQQAEIFPMDPSEGSTNKPVSGAAVADETVQASAWITQNPATTSVLFEIQWYDASLNSTGFSDENLAALTTSYQQFTSSIYTAPANTAFFTVHFSAGFPSGSTNTDFDTVSINHTGEQVTTDPLTLFTTHQGFRFPYNWETEQQRRMNFDHLETMITKYLHKHEVVA